MEAGIKELPITNALSPQAVLADFFSTHTRESVWDIFLQLFKAWVESPDANRAKFRDKEIALFLDQLIDLVAAASQLHQTNRVKSNNAGGEPR